MERGPIIKKIENNSTELIKDKKIARPSTSSINFDSIYSEKKLIENNSKTDRKTRDKTPFLTKESVKKSTTRITLNNFKSKEKTKSGKETNENFSKNSHSNPFNLDKNFLSEKKTLTKNKTEKIISNKISSFNPMSEIKNKNLLIKQKTNKIISRKSSNPGESKFTVKNINTDNSFKEIDLSKINSDEIMVTEELNENNIQQIFEFSDMNKIEKIFGNPKKKYFEKLDYKEISNIFQ